MKPTTEDVLKWARESCKATQQGMTPVLDFEQQLKFAALAYAAGAAAEREECAALVSANAMACADGSLLQVYLASNAVAILQRGEKND